MILIDNQSSSIFLVLADIETANIALMWYWTNAPPYVRCMLYAANLTLPPGTVVSGVVEA